MLAPTHLIAGQGAYLSTALALGHAPIFLEAAIAAGVALVPDIDTRQSFLGRLLPWLAEPIEYHFGHRTVTHSLIVSILLAVGLWWILPYGIWLAVVAGYASHPVLDWMTPSGVEWLWPARWRCVLPGNANLRMPSMGWGELILAATIALSCIPLLILGRNAAYTGGVITSAIGDIAQARARYDAEKGSHSWSIEVEGRENRGYVDISGRYPVIGELGAAGFLLDAPAGVVSVCRAPGCDWYADKAVLYRGDAQITSSQQLVVNRLDASALYESLATLSVVGDVYVVGSMQSNQVAESSPQVLVSGETVSVHYASPEIVKAWGRRRLREVDITVQVRHEPGVVVPRLPEFSGSERIELPESLGRWVE